MCWCECNPAAIMCFYAGLKFLETVFHVPLLVYTGTYKDADNKLVLATLIITSIFVSVNILLMVLFWTRFAFKMWPERIVGTLLILSYCGICICMPYPQNRTRLADVDLDHKNSKELFGRTSNPNLPRYVTESFILAGSKPEFYWEFLFPIIMILLLQVSVNITRECCPKIEESPPEVSENVLPEAPPMIFSDLVDHVSMSSGDTECTVTEELIDVHDNENGDMEEASPTDVEAAIIETTCIHVCETDFIKKGNKSKIREVYEKKTQKALQIPGQKGEEESGEKDCQIVTEESGGKAGIKGCEESDVKVYETLTEESGKTSEESIKEAVEKDGKEGIIEIGEKSDEKCTEEPSNKAIGDSAVITEKRTEGSEISILKAVEKDCKESTIEIGEKSDEMCTEETSNKAKDASAVITEKRTVEDAATEEANISDHVKAVAKEVKLSERGRPIEEENTCGAAMAIVVKENVSGIVKPTEAVIDGIIKPTEKDLKDSDSC